MKSAPFNEVYAAFKKIRRYFGKSDIKLEVHLKDKVYGIKSVGRFGISPTATLTLYDKPLMDFSEKKKDISSKPCLNCAALEKRLAVAKELVLLILPLTAWVMSLNFDEIKDVSDLEGMYEPARICNEMAQSFLSNTPGEWVAVKREDLARFVLDIETGFKIGEEKEHYAAFTRLRSALEPERGK